MTADKTMAAAVALVVTGLHAALLAIVLGGAADARPAHSIRPCETEDSPGLCVYDARHRGDGEGRSFIVYGRAGADKVVFVKHRRAHRLVMHGWCQP